MVKLPEILAHNANLKNLSPGLVGVFVGGTSGICLSTAFAFARHTQAPRIYLIGRNQQAADDAISKIKTLNPGAKSTFLKTDLTLLKNVEKVTDAIKQREKKVNILVMTPGYMTLKTRDPTAENLDKKFVCHFYARMRILQNLQPLLSSAATDTSVPLASRISRVVSVLDPHASVRAGGGGRINWDDPSLEKTYSHLTCQAHASLMGNFFLEGMAKRVAETAYVHAYPSGVATGLFRDVPGHRIFTPVLSVLLKPLMVPLEQSGERHLFAATSARYAPRGLAEGNKGEVVNGSDGERGSGAYWLNWDGEPFAANKKIERTRSEGAVEKVFEHVDEVFRKVVEGGGTYP